MSPLSESLRQQVRERANNRCEYCLSHQDYVMGRLQIDHIQPVAKGGTDTEQNLCLACELCNQYKWTQTEAVDPESEETVKLCFFFILGNSNGTSIFLGVKMARKFMEKLAAVVLRLKHCGLIIA
jgi:HNH endonuclease